MSTSLASNVDLVVIHPKSPAKQAQDPPPMLPVEILRLILVHLTPEQNAPALKSSHSKAPSQLRRTKSRKDLVACCLVNNLFLSEAQPLLYETIHLSTLLEMRRWPSDLPTTSKLCAHIRFLHIALATLQSGITSLLSSCSMLQHLTMEVDNVEKSDCLAECVNGILRRSKHLETVSMLEFTSIKGLAIVYNLPYRLTTLSVSGLYNYKGALWENTEDFINAETIEFQGVKMVDTWDLHFFFRLCERAPTTPPTKLVFCKSQIAFDFLPQETYRSVRSIALEEAPQLLQLDYLDRFINMEQLAISTRHSFVKFSTQLPAVRNLTILEFNDPMAELLASWLQKDYLPNLGRLQLREGGDSDCSSGMSAKARIQEMIRETKVECVVLRV